MEIQFLFFIFFMKIFLQKQSPFWLFVLSSRVCVLFTKDLCVSYRSHKDDLVSNGMFNVTKEIECAGSNHGQKKAALRMFTRSFHFDMSEENVWKRKLRNLSLKIALDGSERFVSPSFHLTIHQTSLLIQLNGKHSLNAIPQQTSFLFNLFSKKKTTSFLWASV